MQDGLQERLDFLGLDAEAQARLAPLAPVIAAHLDQAIALFQAQLSATPSAARFLYGRERIETGQAGPASHWQALAEGCFDPGFAEAATRLGQRHARIGLEPRWHIGGYGVLVRSLVKGVVHDVMAEVLQGRRGPLGLALPVSPTAVLEAADSMSEGLGVLLCGILLDLDFSMSGYVGKLREEAQQAEAVSRDGLREAARDAGAALAAAAEGRREAVGAKVPDPDLAPLYAGAEALADRMIAVLDEFDTLSGALEALAGDVLEGGQRLTAGRAGQADMAGEARRLLAGLAPVLAERAKVHANTKRAGRTLMRRCQTGLAVLSAAQAALGDIGGADAEGPAETLEALGFRANMLAAKLAMAGVGKAAARHAEEARLLAQDLALAASRARTDREAAERALRDGLAGLGDANQLLGDIGGFLDQALQGGTGAGRREVAALARAAELVAALQAGIVATEAEAAAIDAMLNDAQAQIATLARLGGEAARVEPDPTETDTPAFPAPDHAALAAHWHAG